MCFLRLSWLCMSLTTLLRQSAAQVVDPRLALVASSPFRMILRPTESELDFAAIQAVEESIASTLLLYQETNSYGYIDIEVVIQQAELVELEEELPSTRVRFFCLATALETTTDQRSRLDTLVQDAFASSTGTIKFQDLLHSSQEPSIMNISEVAVAPILPAKAPNDTLGSSKKLSTLDIVLIAISGSIFLGILYMIIQHHKDRGYIENQRIRTFSSPAHRAVDDSKGLLMVSGMSSEFKGYNTSTLDHQNQQAPSTPSTTRSGDVEFNVSPETPERIRITAISAMTQSALLSASSLDGSSVQALSETFESPWFNQKVDTSSTAYADNDCTSSSDESGTNNIFQIGVNLTASSKSDNSSGQDEKSTVSSAVSEWMRTICVVPSDGKNSVLTHSRLALPSSTVQSLTASSKGQSSMEQRSLEQSMASSSIGSDTEVREGVETTERVEV